MVERVTSFRDFEHQGWSSEDVALGYHDYLSPITTQAIGALLDAAGVRQGTRVVDIATGAGYAAAAAAERGAEVIGIDFSATQVALARQRYPSLEFREGVPVHYRSRIAPSTPWSAISACHMSLTRTPSSARHSGCFEVAADRLQRLGIARRVSRAWHHLRRRAEPWPNGCPLAAGPQLFPVQRSGPVRAKPPRGRFPGGHCVQGPAGLADGIAGRAVRGDHEGHRRAAALLRAQTPEALAVIRDAARRAASSRAWWAIELMMPAVVAAAEKP